MPANARVERFVPHGLLLDRAACVVPFGDDQLEVVGFGQVALTSVDSWEKLGREPLISSR